MISITEVVIAASLQAPCHIDASLRIVSWSRLTPELLHLSVLRDRWCGLLGYQETGTLELNTLREEKESLPSC